MRTYSLLSAVLLSMILLSASEPLAGEITIPVTSHATITREGKPEILLKFGSLDSLAGKTILRAECVVELTLDSACEDWVEIVAMPITDSWDVSSVQAVVGYDSRAISSTSSGSWIVGVSKSKPGPVSFSILEIVKSWASGRRAQNGILIKPTDEDGSCTPSLAETSAKLIVR